jgi:predicted transcriptional regulator
MKKQKSFNIDLDEDVNEKLIKLAKRDKRSKKSYTEVHLTNFINSQFQSVYG